MWYLSELLNSAVAVQKKPQKTYKQMDVIEFQ